MESANQLELPQVLVTFWEPVLYLVNNLQLTGRLLDLFADQLSELSCLRDRVISGWIASIMLAIENYGTPFCLNSYSVWFQVCLIGSMKEGFFDL